MQHEVTMRMTGFILSLLLTLTAYFLIANPEYFPFNVNTVISIIFALALLQATVQMIFFIDVWEDKEFVWNLSVFLSTVSIIFIIIFFSIWIINHLNYNMR